MRQYYHLLILLCLFALARTSAAQPGPAYNKPAGFNVIPPSPEAAALGKFGEVPVSTYTGLPSVSVPLHTVACGPLQLPVSLSYNASGNKVEEIAPWTGLGWTLNAGGVITRVVRGQPDDGYASTPGIQGFLTFASTHSRSDVLGNDMLLDEVAKGCLDAEPDQFFFNFAGYSGQFSFGWDGQLIQSGDKHVAIRPLWAANGTLRGWQVHTDQGAVYRFTQAEYTTLITPNSGIKNCRPAGGSTHASGWYLTSVADGNRRDSITVAYDAYTIAYDKRAGESVRYNLKAGPDPDVESPTGFSGCVDGVGARDGGNAWSQLVHQGVRVREVTSSDGLTRVTFLPGRARTDLAGVALAGSANLTALGAVAVAGPRGPVRRFDLAYSPTDRTGRLTLETVQESNGAARKPAYRFVYNPLPLPDITSKAQDHWGYYNGRPNTTLLPTYVVHFAYNEALAQTYPGADRRVSPDTCQAGLLRAVVYPTGGRTEFDFEPNTYSFTQHGALEGYQPLPRHYEAAVSCAATALATGPTKTATMTTPFRVPKPRGGSDPRVLVTYTYDVRNVNHVTANTKPYVALLDSTGQEVVGFQVTYNDVQTGVYNRRLRPGPYTLVARASYNTEPGPDGACDYATLAVDFAEDGPPVLVKTGGGLRVRAVRDYPGADTAVYQLTRYRYARPGDPARSSGVVYQEPRYDYPSYLWQEPSTTGTNPGSGSGPGGTIGGSSRCDCVMYAAQSRTGLGTTQGSFVGYAFVRVTAGPRGAANGYTDYRYSSPLEYPDVIPDALPFTPTESQAYATGLLLARRDYAATSAGPVLVSRDTSAYRFYGASGEGLSVTHRGMKTIGTLSRPDYLIKTYNTPVGHAQLDSTAHTAYGTGAAAGGRREGTKYRYDARGEVLLEQARYLATGERVLTRYAYPQMYLAPSPALAELVRRHAWGVPVETTTLKTGADGTARVLASQYTAYGLSGGQVDPVAEAALETTHPLGEAEFVPSRLASGGQPDPAVRERARYERRDARGNVLQYRPVAAAPPVAYVWGYGAAKPVAQVQNATYAQVLAVLGQPALDQLAAPDPGSDAQVRALLAPLRAALPQARVTVYTYDPALGLTSQTDPSGRTTTYEYDALGRLVRTRDEQGRVRAEQEYIYARP